MDKKTIDSFSDLEFKPHRMSQIAKYADEVTKQEVKDFLGNVGNSIHAVGYVGNRRISVVGYSKVNPTKWPDTFKAGEGTYEVMVDEEEPLCYQTPDDIDKLIIKLKQK